jgi:hypothetical protein
MTLFPLVMLHAVVRKAQSGDLLEALSILLFTAAVSGLGLVFWIHMRSKVLVTARGLEVTGLRPRSMTWDEVHSIEARLWRLQFRTTDGRRIEANRSMKEFATLLRLLPNQVRPELQAAAERAVRRVGLSEDELQA